MDGINTFRLLEQHEPDLLISDFKMEPMNGLELVRLLRRTGYSPYIPEISLFAGQVDH